MGKIISAEEVISNIPNGATLMIGGFMGIGTPDCLVNELIYQNKSNLTLISTDTARPNIGIGKLIAAKLIAHLITSHIGTNPETQRQYLAGEIDIDLTPQGTLAERIRAGGYGIGGVLIPTGIGTSVALGKQTVEVKNKTFLVEEPIRATYALIRARSADQIGNLTFSMTARNFNPLMAMAADTVIVESDEMLPLGSITPDQVMTPSVLVDHLVVGRSANG